MPITYLWKILYPVYIKNTQNLIVEKNLENGQRFIDIINETQMTNKHTERYLMSLVVREIQIKTTIDQLVWLKLKRLTILGMGKDVGQLKFSHNASGNLKSYHFTQHWQFLQKLNIYLTYNSALLCLGYFPKRNDSMYRHKDFVSLCF